MTSATFAKLLPEQDTKPHLLKSTWKPTRRMHDLYGERIVAGETGHFAMPLRVRQDRGLVRTAAMLAPSGLTACTLHAARCLAGEPTLAAWPGRLATAAATDTVGSGIGLAITATKW